MLLLEHSLSKAINAAVRMHACPSTEYGVKGSSWYNDARSYDAWHCSKRMHDVVRTSLHSVRRGRREVKGSALASAFLFFPGDASLSASAARAPCKPATPQSVPFPAGQLNSHQPQLCRSCWPSSRMTLKAAGMGKWQSQVPGEGADPCRRRWSLGCWGVPILLQPRWLLFPLL